MWHLKNLPSRFCLRVVLLAAHEPIFAVQELDARKRETRTWHTLYFGLGSGGIARVAAQNSQETSLATRVVSYEY